MNNWFVSTFVLGKYFLSVIAKSTLSANLECFTFYKQTKEKRINKMYPENIKFLKIKNSYNNGNYERVG